MACPCFYPLRRLGAPRTFVPLGDVWAGECRAPGQEAAIPSRQTLVEYCNLGYARGRCARFPGGGWPDAVRFAVAGASEALVSVTWVMEKDCLPFSRGALDYSAARGAFMAPPAEANLERQTAAYVASFLRRKQPAS